MKGHASVHLMGLSIASEATAAALAVMALHAVAEPVLSWEGSNF